MDNNQKSVVLLMKSAITGEKYDLPEGVQFQELEELLISQNTYMMGYIGAMNCGYDGESPELETVMNSYFLEEWNSVRQMQAVEQLSGIFNQNGIDHMPVKGCLMKALYPKPELRPMGDADILIRVADYPRIKEIMLQLGYREGVESDHEYNWYGPDLHVELHKRLVPSYHHDYFRYFGDGWSKANTCREHCWSMTPEDSFIYDFAHFAKHFRAGGVGIRYATDLWVHLRSYPNMDRDYIRQEFEKLELAEFYDNMLSLINAWFEDGPSNQNVEFITDFMFNCSLWGSENKDAADAVKAAQENDLNIKQGKQLLLKHKLFPSRQNMDQGYPGWKKLPLPVAWVCRWFHILFVNGDKIQKQADKTKNLTDETIRQRWEQMEAIGLKFSK